jgi:serine/threonine protein kinase
MLQGHLLYFYMFEFVDGEPLRDILMKNPQLWVNHVGWIMISMATAINFLHAKGFYHLGISPDTVLVRFDDDPNAPRILLFDLGVMSMAEQLAINWHHFFVPPAYTAPELLDDSSGRISHATDIYGLGLTLYELLVGEPAYTYKLNSDEEVYWAVKNSQPIPMNRIEDVKRVAQIALDAVAPEKARRQPDTAVFIDQLKTYFGDVPGEKPSRWSSLNTIFLIIAAILAIAFVIAIAVSVS